MTHPHRTRRPGTKAFAATCGLLVSALVSSPATALTVAAGNARLELPDDQRWDVYELADPDVQIDSGTSTVPSMARVLRLSEGGQTVAALHVSGSTGGAGEVIWNFRCPVDKQQTGAYARDRSHKFSIDCLIAYGPVNLDRSIAHFDPAVARLLQAKDAMVGGAGYFVWAIYANGTARVSVVALVRGNFAGAPAAQTADEDTRDIPAEVLQWGKLLNDQVKASVLSISGRFTLPRMEFR